MVCACASWVGVPRCVMGAVAAGAAVDVAAALAPMPPPLVPLARARVISWVDYRSLSGRASPRPVAFPKQFGNSSIQQSWLAGAPAWRPLRSAAFCRTWRNRRFGTEASKKCLVGKCRGRFRGCQTGGFAKRRVPNWPFCLELLPNPTILPERERPKIPNSQFLSGTADGSIATA